MTRLYNGVRLLGSGPSLKNASKIDMGALPFICECVRNGMIVDLDHFAKMDKSLTDDMDRITAEVEKEVGYYVNLDSGDQVSEMLFKSMGLKQARTKMTRSGDRESVEDEVLTAIQHDHPIVPKLLEFKEFSKLRGTYVRAIQKLARRCSDNLYRLFPNLSGTRVPSGRYTCKSPNLLAMPARTDRGNEIRRGFICESGWSYVSIDESQIEMRIAAHSSQDPGLIRAYENDEDIYSDFAIAAFRLPDKRYRDEISGKWVYPGVDRQGKGPHYPAKTCMLAAIYDVTAKGLLEQMPTIYENGRPVWTEDKCQDMLNSFYIKYPGVMSDRKRHHAMARRYGYVWDMWGRILHCAAVRSVHRWVVSSALREVGNFPYQSGAQGTVKLAMAETHDTWEQGLQEVVKPQLQVHDELLYKCRDDMAEEWGEYVKSVFEHCAPLRVPIKAGPAIAATWGDLEK